MTRTHQNHDLSDDTVMYQMHTHFLLHLIAVVSHYSQNMGLFQMLDNHFLLCLAISQSEKYKEYSAKKLYILQTVVKK